MDSPENQEECFADYTAKMKQIVVKANELMLDLDAAGERLVPVHEL